jgi:MoaA/NifB/PqqE/SkfB family radical SAM enzyme
VRETHPYELHGSALVVSRQHPRTLLDAVERRARSLTTPTRGGRVTLLILEPTLKCNSRCATCYNLDALNPRTGHVTDDEIREIARSLPNLAILSLSGGEPTLHRDLPGVIAAFESHGRPVAVNLPTNGVLPARIAENVDGMCRATRAKVVVGIAVDGVGPLHDEIRRVPGNFESANETYHALVALKRRHDNLRVSANTCVCQQNQAHIGAIRAWVAANWPEVEGHSMSLVRNPGESVSALTPAQASHRLEELASDLEERRAYDTTLFGHLNHAFWSEYYDLAREYRRGEPRRWHCTGGSTSLYVDGLANVYACEMLERIGNLRDHGGSLEALLASAEAARQRDSIAARECRCDHACWVQHSLLTDPRNAPHLARGARKMVTRGLASRLVRGAEPTPTAEPSPSPSPSPWPESAAGVAARELAAEPIPRVLLTVIFQRWTPYVAQCVGALEALDPERTELLLVPDVPLPDYRGRGHVVVRPGRIPEKRNVALTVCADDCEWIGYIDSDCRPCDGWLGAFWRRAERHRGDAGVVALAGPNVTPPEDGWGQQISGLALGSPFAMGKGAFRYRAGGRVRETDNAGTCNLFVRRAALEAVGGFDESLVVSEDVKLCIDLVRAGGRIVFDPEVAVFHHRRGPLNFLRQHFNEGLALRRYREFALPGFPWQHAPSALLAAEAAIACVPVVGPAIVAAAELAALGVFTANRLAAGASPARAVAAGLAISGFHKAYGLGGLLSYLTRRDVHIASREDERFVPGQRSTPPAPESAAPVAAFRAAAP